MQWRVLKEDVLYQLLTDLGINLFTSSHNIVQRSGTLDNNQCTHLLLAHRHTSHHDRHDDLLQLFRVLLLFSARKQTAQGTHALVSSQIVEEFTDVFLKEDDKTNDTHRHQLVKDATQQLHLQHLRHHQPEDDEHQDTHEDVQRARLLHEAIDIEQRQCDEYDVDNVLDTKFEKHRVYYFISYRVFYAATSSQLLSSRTLRPPLRRARAECRHPSSATGY